MIDKKTHGERLEQLMNRLADSVLGLSDEAALAETSEVGADPEQEALDGQCPEIGQFTIPRREASRK